MIEVHPNMSSERSYVCKGAILLYQEDMGPWSTETGAIIPTLHRVSNDPKKPMTLSAGRCLTNETLEEILSAVAANEVRKTILSPHILYSDTTTLAWWKPSHRAPIYFKTHDKAFTKELSGKTVLHPALMFVARHQKLSVYALAQSERPTADTIVCRAPYYNLYENGAMCRGNIRYPDSLSPSTIAEWEQTFFMTKFTHTNYGTEAMCKSPDSHNELWRMLHKLPKTGAFPGDSLIPLKKTAQTVLTEKVASGLGEM